MKALIILLALGFLLALFLIRPAVPPSLYSIPNDPNLMKLEVK